MYSFNFFKPMESQSTGMDFGNSTNMDTKPNDGFSPTGSSAILLYAATFVICAIFVVCRCYLNRRQSDAVTTSPTTPRPTTAEMIASSNYGRNDGITIPNDDPNPRSAASPSNLPSTSDLKSPASAAASPSSTNETPVVPFNLNADIEIGTANPANSRRRTL